ncbi:MAG: hypothetical protein WCJ39_09690 [bacterium]
MHEPQQDFLTGLAAVEGRAFLTEPTPNKDPRVGIGAFLISHPPKEQVKRRYFG